MNLAEKNWLTEVRLTLKHVLVLVVLPFALLSPLAAQQPELRGVWLTNVDSDVMFSRKGIAEAMEFLQQHNFNVVFPVVWNDAKTLYPSEVMQEKFGVRIDPRMRWRDPLQEIIEEARKRNIAVIPWFEYGFASSYKKNGGKILKKFPHWGAQSRDGKLLTKNGFEWMNPYHPEVQNLLLSLIREVVTRYDVDGVQGDDRLPANPSEGGYDPYTRALYALEHNGAEPPADHRDASWIRWRAEKLNRFGKLVYTTVKSIKPNALVTWSPSVYPWSLEEYLQDVPAWINGGYADLVIPQNYRYDFARYAATLEALAPDSIGYPREYKNMYMGVLMNVGTYVIPDDYLESVMRLHRAKGYHGEVFFFYEGLRKNNGRLARLLKEKFYSASAPLPWR